MELERVFTVVLFLCLSCSSLLEMLLEWESGCS